MGLFIDILKRHLLIDGIFSNVLTDINNDIFITKNTPVIFLVDDVGNFLVDDVGNFLITV